MLGQTCQQGLVQSRPYPCLVSMVLEDNSGVVHASMKGLAFLNLFEFLFQFTNKKSSGYEQRNCIDDEKNPFNPSPFFKHRFTSKWGANVNVHIPGRAPNTTQSCLLLDHLFIKPRRQFIWEWNFSIEQCNHAGSTCTGRTVRWNNNACRFSKFSQRNI